MQKKFPVIILMLVITFISGRLNSQSTIVIDNPDTKPVPVKLTNSTATAVKIPFTQFSTSANGAVTLQVKGPEDTSSRKVIDYVLGTAVSATHIHMKIILSGTTTAREYKISIAPGNNTAGTNTYSGSLNIVLRKGDIVNFFIDGSNWKDMLVSGYTMKLY